MDISIVVPVYNAEKYLGRALKSILESLKAAPKIKGEILVVDNNSTDRSFEIMKEFKKENRGLIRILKCMIPGASATRNLGVREAKGKYLWFVDADDKISKTAISVLVSRMEEGADFAMIGANRILKDGRKEYLSAPDPNTPEFKAQFIRRAVGPWQVIVRREWWVKNFKFREGIIHEDMELMPTLILHTDKIISVDKPLYTYHFTPESVLHKTAWDPKYLDIFPALEGLYRYFRKARAVEKYRDSLEWFFIWNLLVDSANDFKKGGRAGRAGFRRSREILRKYFPNWRKNPFLNQKKMGVKFKIRVYLSYFGIVV